MKKSEETLNHSHSTLNNSTRIKGELFTDNNMRIDGTVEGNIHSKAKVVLGPSAQVKGNVICQNADIECTVIGNIYVESQLTLSSKANIKGDIFTGKLIVESGAQFNGKCEMGNIKGMKDLFNPNIVRKTDQNLEKAAQ